MKTKLFSFIFALVASTSFLSAQSGIYNGQKWTLQDGTLTIENEDRCIFAEDLMTKESFEKFTIVNVKGDSTWIFSFQVKNNVTTVYGAKMAGYSDTDIRTYENEDWLISPAFDASKGAYITFDHARGPKSCMGVSLDNYTVWVTNDFEGDVTTANWTQIAIPKHGTVAWTYVNSGEMLIPQENCKPNCRIAWKYVCNANESASWEMKNVLVRVPEANGNTPPQSWDDYKASITKVIIQNGVIHVWSDAFSNCVNLNSLTIPNSVTNIGYNAFSGCTGLTSVTIPNSVTSIGSSAFSGCTGLTSLTMSSSVTSIGSSAFSGCTGLTSVTIPNSVTSIGSSAFSGCTGLTSLTMSSSVTSIGSSAFSGCTGLTSVTIPNSVTSIGGSAFYGCSGLLSVTLGNNVMSIGRNTFYNCSNLKDIFVPCGELDKFKKMDGADSRMKYVPSSYTLTGKSAANGYVFIPAYSSCDESITITARPYRGFRFVKWSDGNTDNPRTVYLTEDQTFEANFDYALMGKCGKDSLLIWTLDTATMSLTISGNGALSENYTYGSFIESITIGDDVTTIGDYAFSNCAALTSITIPNSVTSIGNEAFRGCGSLTSITIPNGVTSIGNYVFYNCSSLTSITIPNSVTSIGNYAFYNCQGLTSITIPNSVTSIGNNAFYYCISLTSVTIPKSVTSIGNYAFYNCQGLTSITIPNSVTSIGNNAFYYCISLTSVTIPKSVTSIGGSAFYDVPNIVYSGTATGAPWGARSLNGYVEGNLVYRDATKTELLACFAAATGEITIPNSVTSIGEKAFSGCTGLTSVTIPNSVTSIGSSAFSGCTGLTSITIPNGVTSIGNNAFYNCSSLTSITIPNSVTSIGNSAFSGCSSLTSITIPNSVTSIGNYAFYNCSSLTSVTIPNSVTSIGNYAFNNVPNIVYSGTATGAPWGARSLNGYVEENLVYRDATKTELLACSSAATGEITIPNDVTSIGNYAFRGCSSLTSITIPNSVTSIGSEAFSGCSSLEDIFVPCGELERFTQMFNDSYNSDYSDKLKIASSPHTLTIKDTKYGSVSVPDYNVCDESVMITAIPDSHCRFVKWSDGNTDNPRPVYLTEDITLEALFVYTLTDKCGKDYLLTWTLDTIKMAMDITGKGSLSDNYTYHTTFATLTIGNEVTTIGANAFSDCDNLQYLTLGSSVRVIESGAFACSDIKTITCYNKRPPTVNNDAFCNLDYETIIYVPKDYLENYQMHAFWGMFDVRPIGASGTETDKVKVEPAETTATVAWPTINGAGSYELVIRDKDGNALCTLVFNAQGQLTSIDFAAAPARDRSNVAAMAQGAGFAFTVTGLESGTMYKYSFITKNASGTVIDTKTGAFTTQSPTALEDIMDDASSASSSSVRKVLQNGQLYILRDGKVYNAVGAEVK